MEFYLHFNLIMGRSPGFGSNTSDFIALFRLALASASDLKSLTCQLHSLAGPFYKRYPITP